MNPVRTNEAVEWPDYGGSGTFLNVSASGMAVGPSDEGQVERCHVINSIFSDRRNGI